MQSNISIGPSFKSSVVVKVVKSLEGNRPIFEQPRVYKTSPDQDYDSIMIVGKSLQKREGAVQDGVRELFTYINDSNLVNSQSKAPLKLNPPEGNDFDMFIAGTRIVVENNHPKVGDANLEIFSDILT